jgi:hypothetical protein
VVCKFPGGSRPPQAYHDEYGLDDGAVFNTKWIPTGSSRKDKEIVREAVEKSIGRMRNPRLDLVQFYWWDYDKKNYVEMLQNAQVRTRNRIFWEMFYMRITPHIREMDGTSIVLAAISTPASSACLEHLVLAH